jgi:hypothetical protein
MKNKIILLVSFSLIVFMSSCKKDNTNDPTPTITSMESLDVPADFNWKTTRDYQINIGTSSAGITTLSSEDGTVIYQKAFVTGSEAYQMKVSLPTYLEKVKISFKGQAEIIELTGTTISHQFNF